MIRVPTPDDALVIFDQALDDPEAYRTMALQLPYDSYTLGAATFHGIALTPDATVPNLITTLRPDLRPTLSFIRRSPLGQAEPNFIHSDRSMGQWTALLYLTPDPPADDGTVFWAHASGERVDTSDTIDAYTTNGLRWLETDRWSPWFRVQAVFNRLLIFNGAYYHSRAIPANYGEGDTARLVSVTFGEMSCP